MERHRPDLVILDISLGHERGTDLLPKIKSRWPEQRVLMFSMQDESLFAVRALRLGAAGYVMKDANPEDLLRGIRQVLDGGICVSHSISKLIVESSFRHRAGTMVDPIETLTPRELQVFRMIGQGQGTSRIAAELKLSVKTVETYRAHIKDKLQLSSGSELVRRAIECHAALEYPPSNGP
jgi:DNA-binding NarL/FixJ family response regulator